MVRREEIRVYMERREEEGELDGSIDTDEVHQSSSPVVREDLYWFDIHKGRSSITESLIALNGLEATLASWPNIPPQKTYLENWRSALRCWIRNCIDFVAFTRTMEGDSGPGMVLRTDTRFYSEAKKRSTGANKRRIRTRKSVVGVRDFLIDTGWIECARLGKRKGENTPGQFAAYIPTQKFHEALLALQESDADATLPVIWNRSDADADTHLDDAHEITWNAIKLTKKVKVTTGLAKGTQTIEMPIDELHPTVIKTKEVLEKFNRMNVTHEWRYEDKTALHIGEPIQGENAVRIAQHKIVYGRGFSRGTDFEFDYNMNGRFYNSLSSQMPSPKRDLITIDGEVTAEIDFRFLHLRMAYDQLGIEISFKDAYEVSAEIQAAIGRSMIKLITLTMINMQGTKKNPRSQHSRKKTLKEISSELYQIVNGSKSQPGELHTKYHPRKKTAIKHLEAFGLQAAADKLKQDKLPDHVSLEQIRAAVEAIQRFHAPIKDYLCSDFGIRAQYLDSSIMLEVMRDATVRNMPFMGMHDSIRVRESDIETALQMMRSAYQKVMNRPIHATGLKVSHSVLSKPESGAVVAG